MAGNPIQSVNGVAIKSPSSYQWTLEDVSAKGAGRTEDGTMHKMRIGQVRKCELVWSYLNYSEVSAILKAFNPEYFNVTYTDPQDGSTVTSEFYAGNRSSQMYNAELGLWTSLSLSIIERKLR